jgi:hypothetical protein
MITNPNARPLAIGAIVYAIVGALWVLIAYFVGDVDDTLLLTIGVPLLLVLIAAAVVTIQRAGASPPQQTDAAELGKWFGIIFAGEGIAIGVGSGILAGLNLVEWIVPLVALLVGLHFLPLARLLKLPFDYLVGGAIMLLVLLSVWLTSQPAWPDLISVGTATLLWLAGWGRLWAATRGA